MNGNKRTSSPTTNSVILILSAAGALVLIWFFSNPALNLKSDNIDLRTSIIISDSLANKGYSPTELKFQFEMLNQKIESIAQIQEQRFQILTWSLGIFFTAIFTLSVANYINAGAAARDRVVEEFDKRFGENKKVIDEMLENIATLEGRNKPSKE